MGILYNHALLRLKCRGSAQCLTLSRRNADRSRAISSGCSRGYRYATVRILIASPARKQTGALGCKMASFPTRSAPQVNHAFALLLAPGFRAHHRKGEQTILSQKEEPNAKS
jgi:hypothetical protein